MLFLKFVGTVSGTLCAPIVFSKGETLREVDGKAWESRVALRTNEMRNIARGFEKKYGRRRGSALTIQVNAEIQ